MNVFLDTNILLDVLAKRDPWVQDSAAILSLIEQGKIDGFVAAHTITTLHYLLRKHLEPARATGALVSLTNMVRVVGVDHEAILKAFSLGWTDFEDAVQAVCAPTCKADAIITRDPNKAFQSTGIPVLLPSELLARAAELDPEP